VKYSAAFRSAAKVGMFIPPTTSPDHIGPGNFGYPGHFHTSVSVHEPHRNSYTFLRQRSFSTRQALPDNEAELKTFAEGHPKGYVFSKDGAAFDANANLARIVREKMDALYPRLARRQFPAAYAQPSHPRKHFYDRKEPVLDPNNEDYGVAM
jgi:hypothetical protein